MWCGRREEGWVCRWRTRHCGCQVRRMGLGRRNWVGDWDLERLDGKLCGGDAGSFSVLRLDWLDGVCESRIRFHERTKINFNVRNETV